MLYIHELKSWPKFTWDHKRLATLLGTVRNRQGRLTGRMEGMGFSLRAEAMLQNLTLDIIKSSEIEGVILNPLQVRSSIARRLGMDIAGLAASDRHVDGVVEMMLDACQHFQKPLTRERLFSWHAALFPTGYSGLQKIDVGMWRQAPMAVISQEGSFERIHFQAPEAPKVEKEMKVFLDWFEGQDEIDPVIKAGIAHLWFVTIHPLDDGNGRITRAITDMQLARVDGSLQRFYSMSVQIRKERAAYYDILERTQKDIDAEEDGRGINITLWLEWYLNCLDRALVGTETILAAVFRKARFWEKFPESSMNERQRLLANKLLDGFDGKLTSSKWALIAKCSQDTAFRDILDLVEKGILKKEDAGGRSTSYVLANEQ